MREFAITLLLIAMIILEGSGVSAQVLWTKDTLNPVLVPGPAGSWDDNYLIEPYVLIKSRSIGGSYRMWYGGDDGSSNRIGRAISSDGVDWTKDSLNNPVLGLGSSGSWEDRHVTAPWVLYDGTTYRMWYHGHDGTSFRVGLATSPDGVDWTKDSLNPVLPLGPSGSWDDSDVKTPVVLMLNDTTFFMWYGGNDGSNTRIGLATSSDGIVWSKSDLNPVMDKGTGWESKSIFPESVLYDSSIFQMWYLGLDQDFIGRTGYATSPDGVDWTKYSENPVLDVGAAGDWDDVAAAVGAVLFFPLFGKPYEMWYDSFDGPSSSIGYATAPDSIPTIGIRDERVIPDIYVLNQNYPNPFNPRTEIRFTIPKSEKVSLLVYNLVGEKVVNLIDELKPAGSYTVKWDASNFASGIYFYRLQAGEFIETRKMVLLK